MKKWIIKIKALYIAVKYTCLYGRAGALKKTKEDLVGAWEEYARLKIENELLKAEYVELMAEKKQVIRDVIIEDQQKRGPICKGYLNM